MAKIPTHNHDDRFYNPDKLIRVFAIMSIVMMVVTVWMVVDDFGRRWKGYQREFMELKREKFSKLVEEAKEELDPDQLSEYQGKVAEAQKTVDSHSAQIEKLNNELTDLITASKIATVDYQAEKGEWDVDRYKYEAVYGELEVEGLHEKPHGEAAEHSEGAEAEAAEPKHPEPHGQGPEFEKAKIEARTKVMKRWDKVLGLQDKANAATVAVKEKKDEIAALKSAVVDAQKELAKFRENVDRLITTRDANKFTLTKLIQSSPVLDLASPIFKLKQVVLPTIRDDIYFAQIQKVDRCTTCHQGIDTPGFENAPQPFTTHPRLDLMLGSRSPHPINKIGCTVCHEGRGRSSHFTRAAHTPQNEEQEEAWKKKYGWHEMHHVIEKMVPLQYTEGKCRVCHKQTEYVPRAAKLNKSVQLVKAAGCYGCHRIEGWDHIRKPAPSLKKVTGKVSRDWMLKWVRDPRSFNKNARMPASFFQSNVEGNEEFQTYQAAELNGVVDYIRKNSEDYKPKLSARSGNVESGKKLVGEIGCLGCHQIDDFEQVRGRFGMAPDLSTVGSKVDANWLYQWVKEPTHYWEDTTMPSLRLTDGEAADITAYLMTKKNPEFESASVTETTIENQKEVLRLYLLRDPKMAPATETKIADYLSKLDSHDVSVELGRRAIGRYGCFGCHEITGFETTQGIGVELTEEGSKPVDKFDFGLIHDIPHSMVGWLNAKFTNTRVFDKGKIKDYLDLLRMPHYGFTKAERDELILFIIGMTAQKITPPAAKQLSAREELVEQGKQVIHKYNCQGCHIVEGIFQELPEDHPKFEENEEQRYSTEGRILAYYTEDLTLGPPVLYTEGSRVHSDWVASFLRDPSNKLRKAVKVRMPTFNYSMEEMNALLRGWAADGQVPFPLAGPKKAHSSGEKLAAGRKLFNELNCLLCHNLGERLTPQELTEGSKGLAPNLRLAAQRLRRDWIIELLKNPQKMIPGTRMPGFWPEGAPAVPDILDGDAKAQMEAVADYVISLGSAGSAE